MIEPLIKVTQTQTTFVETEKKNDYGQKIACSHPLSLPFDNNGGGGDK